MEQQVKFPELNRMKEERKSPVYRPVQMEKEQQAEKCPISIKACEIISFVYMAAGVFLALRLDVVERWWQLLLVVCFFILVGGFFGIMASVGKFYEEN